MPLMRAKDRFNLDNFGAHIRKVLSSCGPLQEMAKANDLYSI
jgi:hypothetical protein